VSIQQKLWPKMSSACLVLGQSLKCLALLLKHKSKHVLVQTRLLPVFFCFFYCWRLLECGSRKKKVRSSLRIFILYGPGRLYKGLEPQNMGFIRNSLSSTLLVQFRVQVTSLAWKTMHAQSARDYDSRENALLLFFSGFKVQDCKLLHLEPEALWLGLYCIDRPY